MTPEETVLSIDRYKALVGVILKDPWMGAIFTSSFDILKSLCAEDLDKQELEHDLDVIAFQRNASQEHNPTSHMPMRRLVYALSESINNTARVLISRRPESLELPNGLPKEELMDFAVKEEEEEPEQASSMVQIVPMPRADAAGVNRVQEPLAEAKEEPLDDALFDESPLFVEQMPKLEAEDEEEDFGTFGGAFDVREQSNPMRAYEEEDEQELFRAFPRPAFGTGTVIARPSTSARADPLAGLVAKWQATQRMRHPAAAASPMRLNSATQQLRYTAATRLPQPPPKKKMKIIPMMSETRPKTVYPSNDFNYWNGKTKTDECPRCGLVVSRGTRKKHYLREHYDHYFKVGSSHVNDIERWVSIRLGRGTTYAKPDIRICLHCTESRNVYRTRLVLLKHMEKKHFDVYNQIVTDYQRMKCEVADTVLHERLMSATPVPIPAPTVLSSSGRIIFRKSPAT